MYTKVDLYTPTPIHVTTTYTDVKFMCVCVFYRVVTSRRKFSNWTRVAQRMYYLQRLAGEDSQTEQAAGDSDDEISELDPSLYGVPQAVEHDKSCQSTRSFLSPHVLITLEEIDAIINAGNLTDMSLKDSAETPPVDKDDELVRASEAGSRPGEANHTGTTATAKAKENSALRKAYYRMRAIFLTDTGQRQSDDDEEDADNSSSSFIWKLLKLQLLPAMNKRGGAAGGGGREGEKSAAKEGGILISYSTELDDLSKFYSIPNADKFSISSSELRSLRCFLHFTSCYYHASSIHPSHLVVSLSGDGMAGRIKFTPT